MILITEEMTLRLIIVIIMIITIMIIIGIIIIIARACGVSPALKSGVAVC